MPINPHSVYRLTILASMTIVGFSVNSMASADCTDTNTCLGAGALELHVDGNDNSAFGFQALGSDMHGWQNTAIGSLALAQNAGTGAAGCDHFICTGGVANTAVGNLALSENTIGAGNTATGFRALLANTTGTYNAAVGVRSLERNRTGRFNTAAGAFALEENTTGNNNTAVGTFALWASTESSSNTAVGSSALRGFNWDGADRFRQQGDFNSAFGTGALSSNDTGQYNTAVGHSALSGGAADGISGSFNTAGGANSLRANTSGSGNTATGFDSLHSNGTGSRNTANGFNALGGVTTGVRNTALGAGAGKNVTTGNDNILIGAENFGHAALNGVIRIGKSSFQRKAFVAGIRGVKTGLSDATAVFIDANGQLGTIKSSRRFKEAVEPMESVSERLFALRPVTFRYREPDEDGNKPLQYGLIAEEVAEVFPELVVYGDDGKAETVSYHLLATLLLNEFQKEHIVILAQATRIAALERQSEELALLKRQVAALSAAIEKPAAVPELEE